jgi:hypothetical protein
VFIRKEEYEKFQQGQELLQALKDKKRPHIEYGFFSNDSRQQDEYDELVASFQPETKPFSDYYAERLEWWKKQFDKEPEKHKLVIELKGEEEIIEFDSLSDANDVLNGFREKMNNPNYKVFPSNVNGKVIAIDYVEQIFVVEGHPDPYTEDEIYWWAKEQLDKEMQNWKVIKEEPTTATEIVTRMTAENLERHLKSELLNLYFSKEGSLCKTTGPKTCIHCGVPYNPHPTMNAFCGKNPNQPVHEFR